jgi:ABC-type proline/glycine betaine transport system permease subunit
MLNKIENKKGFVWLGFAIASFLLFIYGLVLLIQGVMRGKESEVYNILGKTVNSASLGFLFIVLGIIFLFMGITKTVGNMDIKIRRGFKDLGTAYTYISPAIIGMTVLVFFPLVFGVWVAFTNYRQEISLTDIQFPTLGRFIEVFTSKNSDFWDILFVNIWWTIINIVLSVSLGVILALILNREDMKFKKESFDAINLGDIIEHVKNPEILCPLPPSINGDKSVHHVAIRYTYLDFPLFKAVNVVRQDEEKDMELIQYLIEEGLKLESNVYMEGSKGGLLLEISRIKPSPLTILGLRNKFKVLEKFN